MSILTSVRVEKKLLLDIKISLLLRIPYLLESQMWAILCRSQSMSDFAVLLFIYIYFLEDILIVRNRSYFN